MPDTVITKGEFDANIRRFDESMNGLKGAVDARFSSMQATVDLRFKHMDEKMDMKFDALTESIRSLTESVDSQRKEIRADNLATRVTAYTMIIAAILGFLGMLIALMRL